MDSIKTPDFVVISVGPEVEFVDGVDPATVAVRLQAVSNVAAAASSICDALRSLVGLVILVWPYLSSRPKPCRLLVTITIRSQLREIRACCRGEINHTGTFSGNCANVPAAGIDADNLACRLERSLL